MVELALVGVIVFTAIFGLFEFGLLFRDNLTATDAAADAARIGGVVGAGVGAGGGNADFEIVRTVRYGLSAMNDASVDYIVVFKATGQSGDASDQLPTPCKNGTPVAGVCNVYPSRAAFTAAQSADTAYFDCVGSTGPSCSWDPATRSDGSTGAPIDSLGVYVRIQRQGYTGLFGRTWTIVRAQTTRLEPAFPQ